MPKLILVRHGQSQWNLENKFTGWTDVDLSEKGIQEAKEAGHKIKNAGLEFDLAFTSVLKRAIRTLWFIMEETDLAWVPVVRDWRLNERHYGALQGLNKAETVEKEGKEKVHLWRRSYDVKPPLLTIDDPRYPGNDDRYMLLNKEQIPLGENLKDTVERFVPYWEDVIAPQIKKGRRVIITAHGNSLRALIKHLENISDEEIPNLEIPTGSPLVYDLDKDLQVIDKKYL